MKNTRTRTMIFVAAIGTLASATAGGIWDGADTVIYKLNAGSSFVEGCFGDCLCPIWYTETAGTFRLTPISITGTLDTYAITDIEWLTGLPPSPAGISITGSGTYTIFAEFAVEERLELDVSFDGGPVAHYDSGFVVSEPDFPNITAGASVGDMICFDSVLSINASPLVPNSDTNGDDMVNVDDMINVILDFGSSGIMHNGDVDASGMVDVDDAIRVILDWGPYRS